MKNTFPTDRMAISFLVLAMCYLLAGILFGLVGSMQYFLPEFLKFSLSFQKTRPLHVYLVIAWIFTAAQGAVYYFIPRIAQKSFIWGKGVKLHFYLQLLLSVSVMMAFVFGYFGGREYLEFPPVFGLLIIFSWIPFAINFFMTLKPRFEKAPVYHWSWSAGILFFFITLAESYVWLLDYFKGNMIRDITVQWKALGSMVGSWNMLVYGSAMYIMEKMTGDEKIAYSKVAFSFFFLGLINLMFNWGHHTYIVPAAPWVKNVSYVISMTELLLLGQLIYRWRKTLKKAQRNFHHLPFRLLSFADLWIFLNLILAIAISIPAVNYFTHGTHITVAHAMGATIGINSMLLFGVVFYILHKEMPVGFEKYKKKVAVGVILTNISLVAFWISLLGSGIVKIIGQSNGLAFASIFEKSLPYFTTLTISGTFLLAGIVIMIIYAFKMITTPRKIHTEVEPLFSNAFEKRESELI